MTMKKDIRIALSPETLRRLADQAEGVQALEIRLRLEIGAPQKPAKPDDEG